MKGRHIQRLRSLGQLQMQRSLLDTAWQKLEDERIQLEIAKQQHEFAVSNEKANFEAIKRNVDDAIAYNNKLLKSNEVYLYSVKEATLSTITDYKRLERYLGKILFDEPDYRRLSILHTGVQDKLDALEEYFVSTFKISPDQYKAQRVTKNKDFSKN